MSQPGVDSFIDREQIVDLTSRLVACNTTNPPGNEEPAARVLGDFLDAAGLDVRYEMVEPGRTILLARLPGTGRAGHLVLSGHLDVVPAEEVGWDADPFAAVRVGDRLVGRGTADMKGSLASMAVALTALKGTGFVPRGDIVLAASVGEEFGGMIGAQYLLQHGLLAGTDYLVVGEPTGLDICRAQRGMVVGRIVVRGRGAHSSMPHLGVSAISLMARGIVALENHRFAFDPDPILGSPSLTVALIEGGVAANIVPDRCSAVFSMRTVAGQTLDGIVAEVLQVLGGVVVESGLPVEIEVVDTRGGPAVRTDEDHPLVQAAAAALESVRGQKPVVRLFTGATEAGVLSTGYGMPMIIMGPGRLEAAHGVNESVEIEQLVQGAEVYARLAESLLG